MSVMTYPDADVRCADCGQPMTFLEWAQHTHPEPAPNLLAALRASLTEEKES